MSIEVRMLHGVTAGEYTYTRGRNPTIQSNERNALAFLLTIPWTKDIWSEQGHLPMYGTNPWLRRQTEHLLLAAQAIIPTITVSKLNAAILILAQADPRPSQPLKSFPTS